MDFLNSYNVKKLDIIQGAFNLPKTRASKQKLIELLIEYMTTNHITQAQVNDILDQRFNNIVYNYIETSSITKLVDIHKRMNLINIDELKKKSELVNSLMNIIPNHLQTHDDINIFINKYTINDLIEQLDVSETDSITIMEEEEEIVNNNVDEYITMKHEYKNEIHKINNRIDVLTEELSILNKNDFDLKIQKLNKSKLKIVDMINEVDVLDSKVLNNQLIELRSQISIKLSELSGIKSDLVKHEGILISLNNKLITVKLTESEANERLQLQTYDYQKTKTDILEKIANNTLTSADNSNIKKLLTDDDYKVMLDNISSNNKVYEQVKQVDEKIKTVLDIKNNIKNELADYNKLLIDKINEIYQNNNNIAINIQNNKLDIIINKIDFDIANNYTKLNKVIELIKYKNAELSSYKNTIDDLLKKIYTVDAMINSL